MIPASFPVAVLFIGVDELISQIDAAGESNLAVDGNDFSVIPVILLYSNEGAKQVKYGALY